MKRTYIFISLTAGIASVLGFGFAIFQWIWPTPLAFSAVMKYVLIIPLIISLVVLVYIIWRLAYSLQAENKWKNILIVTCFVAIVYSGWIGTRFGNSSVVSDQSLPLYSQVSNVAWNAIGNDQYEFAIAVANVCISTYELGNANTTGADCQW